MKTSITKVNQTDHMDHNPVLLNIFHKVRSLHHVQLFAAPWTVAYQAPPPMEFSR